MHRSIAAVVVGGAGLASTLYADPVLRPVLPRDTDPKITTDLQAHVAAIDPEVAHRGLLYVHLVGSCGHPANNLVILRHAASLGFHVVSVNYPNCPSVNDIAEQSSDPFVFENVRRERLYGVDASVDVDVSRPNCVENRLIRLVQFLDAEFPGEGWGAFLDGETPRWGSIVVGGHSQGSGHAAFISKEHELAGVLMFGGPGDGYSGGRLADWVLEPGVTDAARMVGFTHAFDTAIVRASASYEAFGMQELGEVVNVDNVEPPYRRSHILTSRAEPGQPGEFHGCVVVDAHLARLPDGTPLYAPVWTHMFQAVTCEADFSSDGVVNSGDFFLFLVAFFGGQAPADFNHDGTVNSQDFFDFLGAFFAGC